MFKEHRSCSNTHASHDNWSALGLLQRKAQDTTYKPQSSHHQVDESVAPALAGSRFRANLVTVPFQQETTPSWNHLGDAATPKPFSIQMKNSEVTSLPPPQSDNHQLPASRLPASPSNTRTRLPDYLKTGVEHLSGMVMDDVTVHYNSPKPKQLKALAYTQGSNIHVGPGQEKHLPHEAWHVVQQKQGRVRPTFQFNGAQINGDRALEQEADRMGHQASQHQGTVPTQLQSQSNQTSTIQRQLFKYDDGANSPIDVGVVKDEIGEDALTELEWLTLQTMSEEGEDYIFYDTNGGLDIDNVKSVVRGVIREGGEPRKPKYDLYQIEDGIGVNISSTSPIGFLEFIMDQVATIKTVEQGKRLLQEFGAGSEETKSLDSGKFENISVFVSAPNRKYRSRIPVHEQKLRNIRTTRDYAGVPTTERTDDSLTIAKIFFMKPRPKGKTPDTVGVGGRDPITQEDYEAPKLTQEGVEGHRDFGTVQPYHVILYHEFVHGFLQHLGFEGRLDHYVKPESTQLTLPFANDPAKRGNAFEEMLVVGLRQGRGVTFSENAYRQQAGLDERVSYKSVGLYEQEGSFDEVASLSGSPREQIQTVLIKLGFAEADAHYIATGEGKTSNFS